MERHLLRITMILMVWLAIASQASAQTVVEYVHTDALGSPVAVTNQAGTVIERNDYEPYGAVIGKPNYQGIGYTGHVQDGATGLTYMQQRYYDPQVGLFLSVDPVTAYSNPVGAFSRYAYTSGNPYRFIDPDGRYKCTRNGGTCSESDAKRSQSYVNRARKAHERMAEGAAKDRLGDALEMIGDLNDGNGFVINFTTLKEGTLGRMSAEGMDIDSNQVLASALRLGVSPAAVGARVVVHEGSHKLDPLRPGFSRHYYPNTGLERILTEIRAYGLESAMSNAMGDRNSLNYPGMSLQERTRAILHAAKASWVAGCLEGGGASCSGYKP